MAIDTHLRHPQELFAPPIRYEIPPFQRHYVWQRDEQWEPLWRDVEEKAQAILNEGNDTQPHFMGAVVLQQVRSPTGALPRRIVVDGQQRLTTLQILIDAAQEVLAERGQTNPAKRLATLVLNEEAYRDENPDNAFKVWPTLKDQEAFRHALRNDLAITGLEDSRIVQAHAFFTDEARQWLDRLPAEDSTAAGGLEEALRTKLELVVIDLGADDDPHVIFETLNARGTPLLQSDMVKNRILHAAGLTAAEDDRVPARIKALWPFDSDDWWTVEVGRGFQRRPRIDIHLNHWLTLRRGAEIKAHDEFRAFDRYARTRQEAGDTIEDVAHDMGTIGTLFRAIEDVQLPAIAPFLERRKIMNAGVVTPLLLWLLSADVPEPVQKRCLTALESFLVRRVILGYSARSYSQVFTRLLGQLVKGSPATADRILLESLADRSAQATLWPDDADLLERFLTVPLYQWMTRARLHMVLAAIEAHVRTELAEIQAVPADLQIEHILPQAWSSHWPLATDDPEATERRASRIHTIGNLTLVNGPLDKALSNGPWNEKKATLAKHSVLFLNKDLVHEGPAVWDEDAIEARSRWLHSKAVEIWPHHGAITSSG